jgi:hypothetical protein
MRSIVEIFKQHFNLRVCYRVRRTKIKAVYKGNIFKHIQRFGLGSVTKFL